MVGASTSANLIPKVRSRLLSPGRHEQMFLNAACLRSPTALWLFSPDPELTTGATATCASTGTSQPGSGEEGPGGCTETLFNLHRKDREAPEGKRVLSGGARGPSPGPAVLCLSAVSGLGSSRPSAFPGPRLFPRKAVMGRGKEAGGRAGRAAESSGWGRGQRAPQGGTWRMNLVQAEPPVQLHPGSTGRTGARQSGRKQGSGETKALRATETPHLPPYKQMSECRGRGRVNGSL